MRDEDEIDAELSRVERAIETGRSAWPGMTYEEGVDAALRWAMGWTEVAPMEDAA